MSDSNPRARTIEELAAQLGRPPAVLASLAVLEPDQIERLSGIIAAAAERERTAAERSVPLVLRGLIRRLRR